MIRLISAVLDIIVTIIGTLFGTLVEIVTSTVPTRRKQTYDADFAKPESMLTKNGNGFHIGEWSNTVKESHSHMIALGGSGSHKSTSIVFNTLLRSHDTSFIIHDTSGELLRGTAPALHSAFDYKIFVLNPNNPHMSEGFNCISPAKCKSFTDADKVANVLIRNSFEGSSYDYWAQSAETTTAFFIKAIMSYAPDEYKSLYNVLYALRVFSYDPVVIDKWLLKNKASTQIMAEYKGLVATPDKTLQSTLSTAKTALAVYGSPNISLLTSFDSIDFDLFRKEKCALYICSAANDAFLYRSISATLFESFFSSILSKPPYEKGLLPVMFLIDEAAAMRLTSLSQALALTRKHATSIATLWQDLNQVEHLYGKHESANIFANSNLKVFMPSGQPLETCRMLEQLLGKYQYTTEDGITKTRELLTAQEIHELKKILVLNKNMPPMLLDKKPFFEDKKLLRLSQLPEYKIENKLPFTEPPLLQFE